MQLETNWGWIFILPLWFVRIMNYICLKDGSHASSPTSRVVVVLEWINQYFVFQTAFFNNQKHPHGPISFYGKNNHHPSPRHELRFIRVANCRPSRCPATKRRPSCCCWESYDVTSFCWNEPLRRIEHRAPDRKSFWKDFVGRIRMATTWVGVFFLRMVNIY